MSDIIIKIFISQVTTTSSALDRLRSYKTKIRKLRSFVSFDVGFIPIPAHQATYAAAANHTLLPPPLLPPVLKSLARYSYHSINSALLVMSSVSDSSDGVILSLLPISFRFSICLPQSFPTRSV